jgi:hypothetical protein
MDRVNQLGGDPATPHRLCRRDVQQRHLGVADDETGQADCLIVDHSDEQTGKLLAPKVQGLDHS